MSLDFSVNVNPLGLPPSVSAVFPSLGDSLAHYPDARAEDFCREVARHYPLWAENVIAGRGAIDLLNLAIKTIAPKRALLLEPCSGEYRRLLNLQGTEIRSYLLKENESFQFLLPKILNAMLGVDVVLIGYPNNPTATAFEKEELIELLAEAKRRSIFALIDESFCDWHPERSVAREVKDSSYFFVARSLSCFFSLPGIRAGYGLGTRKLVEKMRVRQDSWSCTTVAQRVGIEALRDLDYQEKSRDWFHEEQPRFAEALGKISGLKVYPSLTNFFLMKLRGGMNAEQLLQDLKDEGMTLRGCNHYVGLDQFFVQIFLRLRDENDRLLRALQEWFQRHEADLKAPAKF